ncbi:MAG: hypothetical protein H6564_17105 [Lewinellaceae bacterium]|nr:hypothetical protein [Lewinellaceae bacterium]
MIRGFTDDTSLLAIRFTAAQPNETAKKTSGAITSAKAVYLLDCQGSRLSPDSTTNAARPR